MQIILENKDERSNSGKTNLMDSIMYTRRIGRCVERKFIRGFGDKRSGI